MIALVGLFAAGALLVLSAGRALADPPRETAPESKPDGFFNALLFMLVLAGVVAHHYKRKRDEDGD